MIPVLFTKQNIDLFHLSPYATVHREANGIFLHHSLFVSQCRLKGDPEKLSRLLEQLALGMEGDDLKALLADELKVTDVDAYVNTLIRLGFIE